MLQNFWLNKVVLIYLCIMNPFELSPDWQQFLVCFKAFYKNQTLFCFVFLSVALIKF